MLINPNTCESWFKFLQIVDPRIFINNMCFWKDLCEVQPIVLAIVDDVERHLMLFCKIWHTREMIRVSQVTIWDWANLICALDVTNKVSDKMAVHWADFEELLILQDILNSWEILGFKDLIKARQILFFDCSRSLGIFSMKNLETFEVFAVPRRFK